MEVDGFGVVSIKVDPTVEELYDIESLAEGTGIAAYMYSNIEGAPAGSKAYSAGYEWGPHSSIKKKRITIKKISWNLECNTFYIELKATINT